MEKRVLGDEFIFLSAKYVCLALHHPEKFVFGLFRRLEKELLYGSLCQGDLHQTDDASIDLEVKRTEF